MLHDPEGSAATRLLPPEGVIAPRVLTEQERNGMKDGLRQ
jgi:hypothetical protein